MGWLATWVEDGDARRAWALAELLEAAGIPARPVTSPDAPRPGALLVHGTMDAPGPGVSVIPLDPTPGADGHRVWATPAALAASVAVFPTDAVAIAAALLGDDAGRAAAEDALDGHGRLRYASADPALAGRPVFDALANAVGAWLEARTGIERIARWPDGRAAAVGLSHDVDHPDRDGVLRAVLGGPGRVRSAPRTLLAKAATQARRRLVDREPGAFWAFDPLIESEARRGFTSTYLFASMPFFGPWGTPFDVAYDVREARFAPVFRRLLESGNEIGLHTGYAAWAAPGRVAAERRRLEDAAGVGIRGNRHHYWHLGPDAEATLREHAAAGLAWDASLAFNDHPGFRRSVSLPFRPWDPLGEEALPVLQLPTTVMDGAIHYRSDDVEAAVETIDGLLGLLVGGGGSLVLDWHLQASVPTNPEYRAWAETYQAVLDVLAARTDTWVTGLDALERWWTARRAALRPGA